MHANYKAHYSPFLLTHWHVKHLVLPPVEARAVVGHLEAPCMHRERGKQNIEKQEQTSLKDVNIF